MKVYDLEHHFYPKELLDYIKTRTEYPMYSEEEGALLFSPVAYLPVDIPLGNPPMTIGEEITDLGEYRVGRMDYAGVDVAVLSAAGIAEFLPREESIKYARLCNDAAAETIKKYPGRFMGTICLPTPYVDDAVMELERAVKELGLSYWHTHSNYGEHYLYEDMFDPIIAKCAEYDIPFYIHPQNPVAEYLCDSGAAFSQAGFGYGVDVMKTSMRMVMKGTFDKYPNLKMILGHMAEFYPYILDRMDNRFGVVKKYDPMLNYKESFTYYFKNKNIFMTTSGIFNPSTVELAIKDIGVDNILLGSDYPYEDFKGSVDFVKNLPISDDDKEKILFRNAEKYILKIAE